MSYPPEITPDSLSALLSRKELYTLQAGPHRIGNATGMTPPDYLRIGSYQLFIKNLINPATPYRKIHLAWAPGIGKTVGALVAANEFIKVYRQLYADETITRARFRSGRAAAELADIRTPSVFVLGFGATETAFIRDLLGYSYFGFVSAGEREELDFRRRAAASGNEADVKALHEFESRLKRRVTDKSKGGFYKFLGYEKFVNRLFSGNGVDFTELEKITQERMKADPDITLRDVVDEYIAAGKVAVNEELIGRLQNSLLICDEIHDTYNKTMKNNRGVAVQYVLDRIPSLRFISLSATPINNSPVEIVDFANYFIDNRADQLRRRDLFDGLRLREGALSRIGSIMFGKVSFIQDTDSRYFPSREIVGDQLQITTPIGRFSRGETLPYLRFIQAEMTAEQRAAIDAYLATSETPRSDVYFPQPSDGFTVYDMVFPTPTGPSFRTGMVRSELHNASAEWKREEGINITEHKGITTISGQFLRRDRIAKWSSKYARLLDDLDELYRRGPSKCLIYHYRVEMSGVLLLAEMLRENGYLDEWGNPTGGTRCVMCGVVLSEHADRDHTHMPIRFVTMHSKADISVTRASLEKYQSADNADGSKYAIMIGGKIIEQSYDFKCIQTMCVLSLSTSIQILLQILGRAVRKRSHDLLPPEKRHVVVRIYLQTMRGGYSPEEIRYIDKMDEHLTTQTIMRELNSGDAAANINRAINMSPELLRTYFPSGDTSVPPLPKIDTLYYTPRGQMPTAIGSTVTYYAHGYYRRDMEDIAAIVKHAFMRQGVWSRDALYRQVQSPDIGVETNPIAFTEGLFEVVMWYLTDHQQTVTAKTSRPDIVNVYDYVSKYVYVNGARSSVVQVGDYYVAIPVRVSESTRGQVTADDPYTDAETYLRQPPPQLGVTLTLAQIDGSADLNYRRAVDTWITGKTPGDFLTAITPEMQIAILRAVIEGQPVADPTRVNGMLALLRGLNVLVTRRQVMLFKDVAAIWTKDAGDLPTDDAAVVGYAEAKTIQIYNGSVWLEVKKTLMNRKIDYVEAKGTIGSLEAAGGVTKLKLRKSLEEIRGQIRAKGSIIDTRMVDRGMACETRSRQQLIQILSDLRGSVDRPKIKRICVAIRDRLIALETAERAAKSRTKYLYGWWDEPVNVKALV